MDRRTAVVTALKEAGGRGVSGEALARSLGVSRSAVAKHVAALREAGYTVVALPGSGYRLTFVPDLPLPEEVRPLLRSAFWSELHGGGETGSTNDDAKALAKRGSPEGAAVLASRQTAGRGRLGRRWSSPPGGVYLSVLLRPPLPVADVSSLSPAVSLGVAEGLRALGAQAGLKWPNDVLSARGGKLAGVLLEMAAESERVEWVVAGVGVNVRRSETAPTEPMEGPGGTEPAYLGDETAETPSTASVAAAVLDGIADVYSTFRRSGFLALRPRYEQLSVSSGRDVTVTDAEGRELAGGRASGVDALGRLVVESPSGVRTVSAGDVTLRKGGERT